MHLSHLLAGVVLASLPLHAQGTAAASSGPDELRTSIRQWIDTMREIQQEEDQWEKDREILQGYQEGLQKEIEDLKEQLAGAKIRKEGSDKQSVDKLAERDRYIAATEKLTEEVRLIEDGIVARIPLFPPGLLSQTKVAQGIESAKKGMALPPEKQSEDLNKRLFAATELLSEVEKFQQGVHVHTELHKDAQDREFRMDVVYFGLAAAYAVNEDGSFASIGRVTQDGWRFKKRDGIAPSIKALVASALSGKDVSFTSLPFIQP